MTAGRSISIGSPARSRRRRARFSSSRRPTRPAGPRRARICRAARARAPARPLDHRRRDLSALLVWRGTRAPSFYDVMDAEDRILFVNTFSKNWAMTGWRIGWIVAHPALGQVIENLIQYSTSGVAQFMQRAAVAALERGESFVAQQIERARRGREISLRRAGRDRPRALRRPEGAFYLFFTVDGETDTRRLAMRLIDEANVGLAPGTAFGAGGERFLRLLLRAQRRATRSRGDARCEGAFRSGIMAVRDIPVGAARVAGIAIGTASRSTCDFDVCPRGIRICSAGRIRHGATEARASGPCLNEATRDLHRRRRSLVLNALTVVLVARGLSGHRFCARALRSSPPRKRARRPASSSTCTCPGSPGSTS